MRRLAELLLAMATLGLLSCNSGDDRCNTGNLELQLAGVSADAPYFITVGVTPNGEIRRLRCPGPDTALAQCRPHGAYFGALPRTTLLITVQQSGAATLSARTDALVSDTTCADPVLLPLNQNALPAPTSLEDYATGFDATTGVDEFVRLAVAVPTENGLTHAVKFVITDVRGAPTVYFQNTKKYPLHYSFYRAVLHGELALDDYEATTYYGATRTQMAGTLVYDPARTVRSDAWAQTFTAPVTLEFFPSDDLTPALAQLAQRLVAERVGFADPCGSPHGLGYVPGNDQRERELQAHAWEFAATNSLYLLRAELYGDVLVQYLNVGKACGTLRYLTPEQFLATPLSFKDIALLSRLPNEVPLVGGTLTEELQTPLAHVNVAARARGTPNMALLGASQRPEIAPLLGQLVCFEVNLGGYTLSAATLAEAQAFWDARVPAEPYVPVADLSVTELLSFADLGFTDADTVGVKAANLAELSHFMGELSPQGLAVPFVHFANHLQQNLVTTELCSVADSNCRTEGRTTSLCDAVSVGCSAAVSAGQTLAQYIDTQLLDPTFLTDTATREATLNTLRQLIAHAPVAAALATDLDAAVLNLAATDPVRLRSSTNAEDLPQFSGAGLYDSYGAELGTDRRPSARVRKVWASAFNFRAFEERAFWAIDQRATMMGVAVHKSYPNEAANGVLITQSIANPGVSGYYVNVQLGEVSVTNPEGGVLPEVLTLLPSGMGLLVLRDRYSTLSPGVPILSDAELLSLYQAAAQVQAHFAPLYGANPATLALDLEFKFDNPNRNLIIKQTRPYYQR